MAEPLRSPLTYDDYLRLPDDGQRFELIEGELLMTPAPTVTHQVLLGRLHLALGNYLAASPFGEVLFAPTDVVLSPTNVVQPDLLFVAREHAERITDACIQGPPDLAIEILSESSRRRDEVVKRALYARYGVSELWVVDPILAEIRVYRLDGDRYQKVVEASAEAGARLSTPLLPGLHVDVAALFARL